MKNDIYISYSWFRTDDKLKEMLIINWRVTVVKLRISLNITYKQTNNVNILSMNWMSYSCMSATLL